MILGLDFDTRAVHAVLLDDDTGHARYIPVPFVDHKPPFQFDDARNVRAALNEAIWTATCPVRLETQILHDGWQSVHLVGIEKPYSQATDNSWKYGLIVGQILACVPRHVPVLDMAPTEWKQLSVGKANASKSEVRAWALGVNGRGQCAGCGNDCGNINASCPVCLVALDRLNWPQDAHDALAIARAAQALNERGIAAA